MFVVFFVRDESVPPSLGVIVTSLLPFPGHGAASLLIPWKQIVCVGKTENEGELKEIFKSLEGRVLPLIFTELF